MVWQGNSCDQYLEESQKNIRIKFYAAFLKYPFMTADDCTIIDIMHNLANIADSIINTMKNKKKISENNKRIWTTSKCGDFDNFIHNNSVIPSICSPTSKMFQWLGTFSFSFCFFVLVGTHVVSNKQKKKKKVRKNNISSET